MQRSVQHRARSPQPPTSPYAGAEAYTLAYSGAPPSQILAGAPPPLPPPVRNPTGPTSARENALEARELALEERLRYVEAMLAAKTRMEGSVSRGAVLRGNQSVSQVHDRATIILFLHCPHLLALDLVALVALDLLLLHLLLVRHHGVRT